MIFDSSRRKIARAKKHIEDLESTFKGFIEGRPYEQIAEPDTQRPENTINKIRLVRPVPDQLSVIAADAINNLRAALDQMVYAVAIASRHTITHAKFPFGGSVVEFERAIAGKAKYLPQDILALLRAFNCYRGGNDLLCALNDWCNFDKHSLVLPTEHAALRLRSTVHATGVFSMPQNPTWDRSKHEVVLYTIGPQTEQFDYDFEFLFFITFDQVETIRGKEAIGILYAMMREVERILMAVEAEAHRIGIC